MSRGGCEGGVEFQQVNALGGDGGERNMEQKLPARQVEVRTRSRKGGGEGQTGVSEVHILWIH